MDGALAGCFTPLYSRPVKRSMQDHRARSPGPVFFGRRAAISLVDRTFRRAAAREKSTNEA